MASSEAKKENINGFLVAVQNEYAEWENTPPNIVNKGIGVVTTPIAYLLNPVAKKLARLLENVISGANNLIADAIEDVSDAEPDFEDMDVESFKRWFEKADVKAKNWKTSGIAFMSAEGVASGKFGAAALLAEIPISFGTLIAFSNKIALTYGLPIKTESIQIAIVQAIAAGSSNNVKEKLEAVAVLKTFENVLYRNAWKNIYAIAADNVISPEKVIVAVRDTLIKMGVKVTHKKAGQIIPVIAMATGAVINGAWAADALEAVRQYSRQWIVEKYAKQ